MLIVMRRRRFFIASLAVAVIAGVTLILVWRCSRRPFRTQVLGTHWHEMALYVDLNFTNTGATYVEFADDLEVQARSGGKWLQAQKFEIDRNGSWWGLPPSFGPGESSHARIPCSSAQAEACRIYLRYRGASLRWRAEGFLVDHDWFSKAPRLFGWPTLRLPEHPKWRRSVLEFELPKETRFSTNKMHNLTLHWTGSSRFSLVPMGPPLAAAPGQ
jgi:hypothetical protein